MYDISVIVPTFNVEKYIEEALLSVINQTFKGSIELIVIDDCSTDNTVQKIEEIKSLHKNFDIKLLKQERNMRQGTARNRGIKESNGKYIVFLDGDDLLDKEMFERLFHVAEKESFDFVICDWIYYYQNKGLVYVNNERFMTFEKLEGENCEELLAANTYFTVNKMYKREFIVKNKIFYGEKYIYEDYEFYVDVAQKANKIGIVSNPLYKVRVNSQSITKSNRVSSDHVDSLLQAVEATIAKFNPRSRKSYYNLYRYIVTKSLNYTKYRAPLKYRRRTMKKVLYILNATKRNYYVPNNITPFYHVSFGRKIVQKGQTNRLIILHELYTNKFTRKIILKFYDSIKKLLKNKYIAKLNRKRLQMSMKKKIEVYKDLPLNNKMILFLGFDYRYEGNSKYLFDYMLKNNRDNSEICFVTKDRNIPSKYRVAPRTDRFYKNLAEAKYIISESWIPLDFQKKSGQKWIQLWHGTPFKKLLFDSHEKFVMMKNSNHKKNKQKDIARWDLLLADSEIAVEKFKSAFIFEENNIYNAGYPRVQYLKDNFDNDLLKNKLRKDLGISKDQKIILYVPTWRDYNFRQHNLDLDYVLDLDYLQELLGKSFVIINKNHYMANNNRNPETAIIPSEDIEVQNLLLIADVIISDYSSIIFDAMSVDKPFYLYIKDLEKYRDARGVYEDMYHDLTPFVVSEETVLAEKIMIQHSDEKLKYRALKRRYTSENKHDSNELIYKKIMDFNENEI